METMQKPAEGLNFDKVWAALMETRQVLEEASLRHQAEWKEELAESRAKWERELAESSAKWKEELSQSRTKWEREFAELERLQKRNEKIIGGLGDSIGYLIETLIAGGLCEKFKDTPYSRLRQTTRRLEISDGERIVTDIDILLFDSDLCMAVEVKREPSIRDIDHHVKRMELFKKYAPLVFRSMTLVGAVAGGVVPPEVRDYAQEKGFFVLELNGEAVSLVPSPPGFKAREW